jgi:hypothetical protein
MKTRVLAFDNTLLTRLDDANFHIDLPGHVFYLQDDADAPDPIPDDAAAPTDANPGTCCSLTNSTLMTRNMKPTISTLERNFSVNANGESVPAKVTKRARDNEGKPDW